MQIYLGDKLKQSLM